MDTVDSPPAHHRRAYQGWGAQHISTHGRCGGAVPGGPHGPVTGTSREIITIARRI